MSVSVVPTFDGVLSALNIEIMHLRPSMPKRRLRLATREKLPVAMMSVDPQDRLRRLCGEAS